MTSPPRHWPQYVGAFLVFVLLAGVASASAALLQVKEVVDIAKVSHTAVSVETKGALDDVVQGKPQTLLLIGSDKRDKNAVGDGRSHGLSDTLMLVRLDPEQGAIAVLSVPRDTKAEIPLPGGGFRTAKINEAYSDGGAQLTIRTVRKLMGLPINHVLIINFGAFERAVNRLGCLYEDVDRTYFNDNSQGQNYATINVKSGYQLLCGSDTLDWVRFRHTDSDFVRGARQQAFLRSAKSQIAASQLINDRNTLIRIFATYSQTDITSTTSILGLLKLALASAHQPVRNIAFRGDTSTDPSDTFVTVTDANLALMRREFTELKAAKGPAADTTEVEKVRKKTAKKVKKERGLAKGLIRVTNDVTRPDLVRASFNLSGKLPVYYPSVRYALSSYTSLDGVRSYNIISRTKKKYPSFRLSIYYGQNGQYYGVQGTTWRNPPILGDEHTTVTRNGRKLLVFGAAGGRDQIVAWKTPKGVYWVSNTLSNSLSNAQMLDIAANLRRVPG
ncbi:MAG: LCP family protein [Solirubrobacteraceae bacterium]|nr:LCP family protein [Patulibacter sp.]